MYLAKLFFCVFASGAIYGLAWASNEAGPIGLIGLALFFYQQARTNRWWSAGLSSVGTGTTAYWVACSWFPYTISYLTGVDETCAAWLTPIACLVQGGHFVLFALLWFYARRYFAFGWILAPALWVLTEELWPGFFPCKAGNLLIEFSGLCQVASIGGSTLVSFQAAVMSGLMGLTVTFLWLGFTQNQWRRDWFRVLACGIMAIFFSNLIGGDRVQQVNRSLKSRIVDQGLNVLIVQVDTDQPDCQEGMVKVCEKFRGKVDLFVWPECSLGNYHQNWVDLGQGVADRDSAKDSAKASESCVRPYPNLPAFLLAGGDSWVSDPQAKDRRVNFVSAFLINEQEQVVGRHDKVHLMPYGEMIPGEGWLPFLRTWYGGDRILSRGSQLKPIGEIKGVKIGAVLCCEDMQASACRNLVAEGADILVTLGSGAAFDSPIPLRQHFRIAHLRAIENGKYFLRCTSRGVSGLISPTGETVAELPSMKNLATPIAIPRSSVANTLYTRWGEGASYILIGFSSLVFAVLSRKKLEPLPNSYPVKKPQSESTPRKQQKQPHSKIGLQIR